MKVIEVDVADLISDKNITFGDSWGVYADTLRQGDTPPPYDTPEAKLHTLTTKLQECSANFIQSIEDHGIKNPPAMIDNMIQDGHHRLAVAWSLGMKVSIAEYECYDEFDEYHKWEKAGTVCSRGKHIKETF